MIGQRWPAAADWAPKSIPSPATGTSALQAVLAADIQRVAVIANPTQRLAGLLLKLATIKKSPAEAGLFYVMPSAGSHSLWFAHPPHTGQRGQRQAHQRKRTWLGYLCNNGRGRCDDG